MDGRPGLSFVERFGDEAGEALWLASLAMLEQAIARAREGAYGRWRHYPAGELRRLRRDLARALAMAREASQLQELVNDELRSLTADLDGRAREAARGGR